jgi:DNA-binding response OmpR family regulator
MTGFADQRERASGLNMLIHDVITKPFTLATIRAAVDEALIAGAQRRRSRECPAPEPTGISNP